MYSPRVAVPSRNGDFVVSLDEPPFADQLLKKHQHNYHNVALLISCWVSLLSDSPLLLITGQAKPNTTYYRFTRDLSRDLFSVIGTYAELGDMLAKSLQNTPDGPVIRPLHNMFFKTPVFKEYEYYAQNGDPQVLRFLLSFLWFGKKLYYESDELKATAFHKWLEVEEGLESFNGYSVVDNMKPVARTIFTDWTFDHFLPVHGSGAVAERGVRGIVQKNKRFAVSSLIFETFLRSSNPTAPDDTASLGVYSFEKLKRARRAAARLLFVNKTYRTQRSICPEPLDHMWAQQGVRLPYEGHLKKSILRFYVSIDDQSKNQEYSAFGSFTSDVDTIDLSSASDSVAWELVRNMFPSEVLKYLAATRSRQVVLPDGRIFDVKKFAPMGSALCFPVQCTIFSAVIMTVGIAMTYGLDWRRPGALKHLDIKLAMKHAFKQSIYDRGDSRFAPFRVYGDDIVCDKRMTSSVIDCLSMLGFKVNTSKSFVGEDAFRESCGEFHAFGATVTPFFFKVKKIDDQVSVKTMAGVVDHANRAYLFGYKHLRRCLIQFALNYPIEGLRPRKAGGLNPIAFSSNVEQPMTLFSCNVKNAHLRVRRFSRVHMKDSVHYERKVAKDGSLTTARYPKALTGYRDTVVGREVPSHIALQRDEIRSITTRPAGRVSYTAREQNYLHTAWWRSRYHGSGSDDLSSPPVKADLLEVEVGWRWTASEPK